MAGKTVLVAGGAGAVGHYAIELAKHGGARVITTVSGPQKAELAAKAGADLVVNYREPGAADQIKSFAGPAASTTWSSWPWARTCSWTWT